MKSAYQFFHDRRHSALPLPELQFGQAVRVKLDGKKGWEMSANVFSKCNEPRSYVVKTDNGAVLRRNRRHLQAVPEPADQPEPPLQLPSSPPSAARPSHRDPAYVQRLKDPPPGDIQRSGGQDTSQIYRHLNT